MPHQDQGRVASAIGPALDWLVSGEAFGSYTLRRNSRFTHAREVIASHTHDQRQSVTYQAFVKLLRRHSASLLYAGGEGVASAAP